MNTIKNRPSVGDICIVVNGEKKFVSGSDCTTAFIDSQKCLGVVYDVQGNYVRIVGGINTQSKQWSCVADYEITAIPSASGDYAVTLNNVAQGNFTYTKSEGTIAEFTTQLNTWLAAQDASSKAAKWEAYTNGDHSYLQMKTYDEYESTNAIAGCTLVKLIGNELADYTNSTCYNQIKQSATYNGMCRARLEAYVRDNASANCNPTEAMDGTTRLFVTFPCSYAYYSGNLGVNLRAHFDTYAKYLDACMVRERELNKGIMQFRDGQLMTDLLKDKTVLKAGVETKAYTAANYAATYDCGVDGYGAGTFWLPSMYELAILMKDIATDQSDKVNVALGKKTGWSRISPTSYRWSCCRCYSYYAWSYGNGGFTYSIDFYNSLTCSVVSAFTI